jgi:ATP-dependent protease ClpP protease subunit
MTAKNMMKKSQYFVLSNDSEESVSDRKDSSILTPTSNEIYFYDDVTRQSIFNLNKQISDVSKTLSILQNQYNLSTNPTINLYVSSDGGEVFPALSSVDRIKNCKIPVDTYVEGLVASAATLISVVGRRRYISKNAFLLIHEVRSEFWGNFSEFQDENKNMELLMRCIKKIYLEHTKLKENELSDILKHDIYLDANEALKYGLVDEII